MNAASEPGRLVGVHGSVIDVRFATGPLPAFNEALHIARPGGTPLLAEVQQHLDERTIRAVALADSSGLARGFAVAGTGAPISVPVGDAVLGRLLGPQGEPIDRGAPLPPEVVRRPIHACAPPVSALATAITRFHTGIKVIDLLAPLISGGKAAMFGGAGVGEPAARICAISRAGGIHPLWHDGR